MGYARIIKIIYTINNIVEFFKNKDFDKVEKSDIEAFLGSLNQGRKLKHGKKPYSEWTLHSFKLIFKRFYKWLLGNDEEVPKIVKFFVCTVNETKLKKLKASDYEKYFTQN